MNNNKYSLINKHSFNQPPAAPTLNSNLTTTAIPSALNPFASDNNQINNNSKMPMRAKSAILSHLNLNTKAREELEKIKMKAKLEKKEEREEKSASKNNNSDQNSKSPIQNEAYNNNQSKDQEQDKEKVIPITSFANETSESSDDDDEASEKKIRIVSKKQKMDDRDEEDEDEEDEQPTRINLSNILQAKNKIKQIKSNSSLRKNKKAPIIKSSQHLNNANNDIAPHQSASSGAPKSSFIGPKLPFLNENKKVVKIEAVKNENGEELDKKEADSEAVEDVKLEGGDEEENQQQHQPKSLIDRNKLNYSKDELAKYDHLFKMSQLYAKYNHVSESYKNESENSFGTTPSTNNNNLILDENVQNSTACVVNNNVVAASISQAATTTTTTVQSPIMIGGQSVTGLQVQTPGVSINGQAYQQQLNCNFLKFILKHIWNLFL
jgi:hypothetical protein